MAIREILNWLLPRTPVSEPPPPETESVAHQQYRAQITRLKAATIARHELNEKLRESRGILETLP